MASASLTILFQDPFWIGLYERQDGNHYEVAKITFGAEPKDYEVYAFLEQNWRRLSFSPALASESGPEARINPKRQNRLIHRQTQASGIGTKAQQALKLQQEQGKQAKAARSRAEREAEKQRQFSLHQKKRKEKHRGH